MCWEKDVTFDEAFEILIGHEGGYVNNPKDPGGETKYGISKRAYPSENIKGMTLDRAKYLYRRDYWDAIEADRLPAPMRLHIFDMAVNAGNKTAIKLLQKTISATPDGVLGPKTRAAIDAADPTKLTSIFNGQRLRYYTDLGNFSTFGKGWVRRVADNMIKYS